MYLIERWLEKYSPVSFISDGKPQIEGSRLLPSICGFPSEMNDTGEYFSSQRSIRYILIFIFCTLRTISSRNYF